jgi:signal transduction histidine kinase
MRTSTEHSLRDRAGMTASGLVAASILASVAGVPTLASVQAPVPAVLVLFSDEGRLPATSDIYEGIEQQLATGSAVAIFSQFLDSSTFAGAEHDRAMVAFLQARFAARPIDVLVTVGPPASAFAERHGRTIWPGARLVALAFAGDELASAALATADARIALDMDYLGTAERAMAMFPQTTDIVLVGGTSSGDRRYFAQAREALAPLAGRVRIVEWRGLSLGDIQTRLSTLGDESVVLVSNFFEDEEGRQFIPAEAIREFASASRRPIFGLHDSWIGVGAIGGHVIDYEALGRQAAGVVRSLLDGVAPVAEAGPTRWVFDARQLDRWDVARAQLPAGAEVRFQEPGIWDRYRGYMLAAAFVLIAQGLVIGLLLVERRARRRTALALGAAEDARRQTEDRMRLQLHELAHVNLLASIGQTAAAVAHELNQPLTAVLSNAQALRRLLARQGVTNPAVSEIVDDIISEDKRAGDVIQRVRRLVRKDPFDWAPVDLNGMVHDVTRLMAPAASTAGVRLDVKLDPALPPARGDRIQLQQVMLNLVQNGVQAAATSSQPGRQVQVTTTAADGRIEVSVRDSGPGIDQGVLPRLFEPFVTTKARGLGLGLSISRTIVEQHGGSIAAINASGGGAEFQVHLPAEPRYH